MNAANVIWPTGQDPDGDLWVTAGDHVTALFKVATSLLRPVSATHTSF